jgi:formamidopyrimidine-DNA glycosylase
MPELPEVEVLRRHLAPLLRGQTIHAVRVRRAKTLAPTQPEQFKRTIRGATFAQVSRRGKYLLFALLRARSREGFTLVGHLGMTGRMYLLSARSRLPKHAAVVLNLGQRNFIFEDTRYFGRLTLDTSVLAGLGPEPLDCESAPETFVRALKCSRQPIKVKLLDQRVVAGVGNIYASEALFRARVSPRLAARRLKPDHLARLWQSIRETLTEAIQGGSTVPLDYAGTGRRDGLFYFGRASATPSYYEERLRVYDRAGKPCVNCGRLIRRMVQAGRSTYYCPKCQA